MSDFPANIDLSSLNGATGFRISSPAAGDFVGGSVASAGDVNGDGYADMIVGASGTEATDSGATYVVFGTASGFGSTLDVSNLNGSNGFRLSGAAAGDRSGYSVASAGDINGDGFADVIVGAHNAGNAGTSYVLFGHAGGFASNIDLSSLDGSTGFKVSGAATLDGAGWSVASAGDVNGDGLGDVIIGAIGADPNGNASGAGYVLFGQTGGFGANVNLASLNGGNGFKLSGVATGDRTGGSVASAGDVNGDGFDDVIVGAYTANGNYSGASYVVFGKAGGFAANTNLSSLDGSNGFEISGAAATDFSGFSVASAGDVNGDGFADLIVGAKRADANGKDSGASYVVFGKAGGFAANTNLASLDGNTGFRLIGGAAYDSNGFSVASAGDVNGDGFDDVIVGSYAADPHGQASGASYVVFGKAGGFAANINLANLNGSDGFKLSGVAQFDISGWSVASAGDVNGDGFDDVMVGAPSASLPGQFSGATYVVYGREPDSAVTRVGSAGSQAISGGKFNDTLIGLAGDDVLNGNDGHDSLLGGEGDDVLRGGAEADAMQGGAGDDIYHVDNIEDLTVEFANEGSDTVRTTVSLALGQHVENLIADTDASLTLRGNGLANIILGAGGNDTLIGGGGDDLLRGNAGTDTMQGDAGHDTYYVDRSDDTVTERANEGTDTVHTTASFRLGRHVENLIADSDEGLILRGNSLANEITGGYGADRLLGNDGDDTLTGSGGNDILNGGAGADAMDGGDGDDKYFVDNAGDTLSDSSGEDSVYTTIDRALGAGFERLYARSDAGLALTGNSAANTITGGGGSDTITGGGGRDVMTGGADGDTFVFRALSDSGTGGARDLIQDFAAGVDTIDLTQIDASRDEFGNQAFNFIGADTFTGTASELQAKAFGADTLVSGDVDGDGKGDFQILLNGHVTLQATDFML